MRSHLVRAAALAIATCATASVLAFAQDGSVSPSATTMLNLADTATRGEQPYPANVKPQAHYPQQRRSVVHHYPYPYPAYYHGESQAGFRNPEGRGRYAEFYEPEDLAPDRQKVDPVKVATFGQGGIPDRNEQINAYNAGTQRYNSIQQSIDDYARPYMGFGFGVGGFGGFW